MDISRAFILLVHFQFYRLLIVIYINFESPNHQNLTRSPNFEFTKDELERERHHQNNPKRTPAIQHPSDARTAKTTQGEIISL